MVRCPKRWRAGSSHVRHSFEIAGLVFEAGQCLAGNSSLRSTGVMIGQVTVELDRIFDATIGLSAPARLEDLRGSHVWRRLHHETTPYSDSYYYKTRQ